MVPLKLYNTLTRKKEIFRPINPPKVGLYTCGPTVYLYAHIGNFRTYIFEDILRRVLEYNNYKVEHVMNITDVGHLFGDRDEGEDKVEAQARKEKKSAKELAEFYTKAFRDDMQKLNLLEPTLWCKATEHISEMIALIVKLEEKGFAYQTSDGVYFDTAKFPDYGELAHLDIEGLKEGARVEVNPEKKNPTDFALWKFSPADQKRQMEWDSPWGVGFPGWHLECSAMSMKYLGETFDIHTGGIDHIPVHHTNEIAQSEAATGKKFVQCWLHGAFLELREGKMGKSEGNVMTISELEEEGFAPTAFRYLCLTAHYRSPLKFTREGLQAAQTALNRLRDVIANFPADVVANFSSRSEERGLLCPEPHVVLGKSASTKERAGSTKEMVDVLAHFSARFGAAINNDLNMPQALALVWELVKSDQPASAKHATLLKWDKVLGLNLDKPFVPVKEVPHDKLPQGVLKLVERREELRREGNFEGADEIRQQTEKMGFVIQDTPEGPKVRVKQ